MNMDGKEFFRVQDMQALFMISLRISEKEKHGWILSSRA